MSKIGLRVSVSVGLLWLCSACSPVSMLNAIIPENGYHRFVDIRYGETSRHKLDIYLSNHSNSEAPKKTVIFFYGGGWDSGDKEDYKFVAEALSSAGFDVVIPDYRLYAGVLTANLAYIVTEEVYKAESSALQAATADCVKETASKVAGIADKIDDLLALLNFSISNDDANTLDIKTNDDANTLEIKGDIENARSEIYDLLSTPQGERESFNGR